MGYSRDRVNIYGIAKLVLSNFTDITVTAIGLDRTDDYWPTSVTLLGSILSFFKKRPIRAAEVKSGKSTDTQESLFLF